MSGVPQRPTATVSVQVRADVAFTFERFVRDVDQWWRRGPKYRHAGRHPGTIRFEGWLGGRVYEAWTERGEARVFELGRITAWEPPHRLAYTWCNATFAPHEETEVEVTFQELGGGTLVTVRHTGWERLRPDHPARHGQDDAAFARELGLCWGEQLSALRESIAAR